MEKNKRMRKLIPFSLVCLYLLYYLINMLPVVISATRKQSSLGLSHASQKIPVFDHVIWVVLENRNYDEVIGNLQMPYLNRLASDYVLLDQYYAVQHPSLPNYIAMVGGDTFRISKDCIDCYLKVDSLADRIEAAGHTWKTYQEDMPSACFIGNQGQYVQRHNPFIYFNSIRLDSKRCQHSIVPLNELKRDLKENNLPDFAFISPNLCHSGHDCDAEEVDQWLQDTIESLRTAPALGKNSLIVITYDEAKKENTGSCCNILSQDGGRVATVLISPFAKAHFIDSTHYSHYSLLKTILLTWSMPDLALTGSPSIKPITAPWE
jgi:phosphatidylinositol-3-phosphatase